MPTFEENREEYIILIKNNEQEKANKLYWEVLFPEVEKKFLEKSHLAQEYDWLIITGGFSPEFHVLTIKSIKPKKIYFIGTKEFKDFYLDEIIEKSNIKASDYIIDTVEYEELDVTEVYEKIRNRLPLFENKKVLLDLTRGKRIMAVGAGMVGSFFGFDLAYIDEEWLKDIRMGLPGTERLVHVSNPFEVFGDLELKEARDLFNYYDYTAAIFLYKRLSEIISDPRKAVIEKTLAEMYSHWKSFNFKAAQKKLEELNKKAKQFNIKLARGINKNKQAIEILNKSQEEINENLEDHVFIHLITDLYTNALRRAEVGMFEDAISRLYRSLELISQYRLLKQGIYTTNPNIKQFEEEYKKLTMEIYEIEKPLPTEIGIKDGLILLYIKKDYLLENKNPKDLKDIFGVIRARDVSIVAHGLKLAGEKVFKNFQSLVKEFLMNICEKENISFTELIEQHTFIKL